MKKYTLAQILEAWEAAFGEDMMTEYPGFIQRLTEITSDKQQATSSPQLQHIYQNQKANDN